MKKLLLKYDAELFKMGSNPQKCEDFCGQPGLMGLKDNQIRMNHVRWVIAQLLNNQFGKSESDRLFGFVQGVMWSMKMRSILEVQDEAEELNA